MASQYRQRGYRPNELIHLQCRGFERRAVFLDDRDQLEFRSSLRRLINLTPAERRPRLLSAAQLRNHQHIFMQNGPSGDAVSSVITSLKISYAKYFNNRYGCTGPVFETPFKARRVRGGDDIVNVIAYIHLNPDQTLREQNSTHAVYTGEVQDPFIDTSIPLRAFGGRERYVEFFNDTARLRAARAAARRRLG